MPSATVVEQDVCSFGIFSILTMQTRQEPSIPEARVIAVIRDLDPALDGGLQNGLPLLDRDRPAINRQRDGFHNLRSYIFSGNSLLWMETPQGVRSFPWSQRSISTSAPLSALAVIVADRSLEWNRALGELVGELNRMFSVVPMRRSRSR